MTYNPRYYGALIEACGFAKAQDLYAYEMDVALLAKLVDRYKPAVMSSLEGDDISVRQLDPSRSATKKSRRISKSTTARSTAPGASLRCRRER